MVKTGHLFSCVLGSISIQELRSHKLCSVAKNKTKQTNKQKTVRLIPECKDGPILRNILIYHTINRAKGMNHMIISIDTEEVLDIILSILDC